MKAALNPERPVTRLGRPRIVGVIPVRYGSTRFEGKALAVIAGKTLIRRVYERAAASESVSELVVATDDSRIAAEVRGFGAAVVMTSPDHKCGTERVAEAAARLDADIVVDLQGDEIVSDGRMLDECVGPLLGPEPPDVSTLASVITDETEALDPNVVKVVTDLEGNALYFSRSPIPCAAPGSSRRPSGGGVSGGGLCAGAAGPTGGFLRHAGIYAYRSEFLQEFVRLPQTPLELAESLEQLRVLEHGRRMRVVLTRHFSVAVDSPPDIVKAERFIASLESAEGGRGPVAGGRAAGPRAE